MTEPHPKKKPTKEDRLAESLRANLAKRKQQERQRTSDYLNDKNKE